MFIQTEDTPNPDTLKFLPGKVLIEEGTLGLRQAASNNFASILFEDQNVKSVFIGKDFVTITKKKRLIGTQLNLQFCQKYLNFFSWRINQHS